jgi:hypothetical protein
MTRLLLVSESCEFVYVGLSLWREDGSVVYNCCWPSPAQSLSGPSSVGLVTIFYCFRFEILLFVASYDSQGYGGGIRPCLHTGSSLCSGLPRLFYPSIGRSRRHLVESFCFLFSDTTAASVFVTAETEIVCLCMRCRVKVFTIAT